MTDDVRYTALARRIDSEQELFGSLVTRLKEVAADMQKKYKIDAVTKQMIEYAQCLKDIYDFVPLERDAQRGIHRVVDFLIATGREKDAAVFTDLERPSFIQIDPLLSKLYKEGYLTQDHLDLYAARKLLSSIDLARPGKDKGPRERRILYEILSDEVIKLANGNFTSPGMLAEQASIRGKIAYTRGLRRGVENEKLNNLDNTEVIKNFKEAAEQYEKALKYNPGNKDFQERISASNRLIEGLQRK